MGHKLFFMSFILFVTAGIAFMAAFSMNLLPPSLSQFVYTFFTPQSAAHVPYLEKFEGHWSATFNPAQAWSQIAKCTNSVGTITIHNGELSGTVGAVGSSGVTGSVSVDGVVKGGFTIGGQNKGTFTGRIVGMGGSLQWKDSVDCGGSIVLQKLEPVHDPVMATVSSFIGGVTLQRSTTSEAPVIDEPLYEGDVLNIPANASIHLMVGTGFSKTPLDLTGPTTYTVPAPEQ
jgi:hypothetical protein